MVGGCTHIRHLFWSSPRRPFVDGNIHRTMREYVPLSKYTTLRVGGPARYFFVAQMLDDIRRAALFAEEKNLPLFVLGGGSNILFSDEGFPGVVVKNELKGIVYDSDDRGIVVHANGGVEWDTLVANAVSRGLWGLENLSGIPGTVGAVPIQNIGAYGMEAKDTIMSVDVYDTGEKRMRRFTNEECAFAYRDSMFKQSNLGRFIITKVAFRLSQEGVPNVSYADLVESFANNIPVHPEEIRKAVLAIRAWKIPNPNDTANAGSFFKNPIVSEDIFAGLAKAYPDIRAYPADGSMKISAAWLIDHVGGWKGVSVGGVSVCDNQPLVMTHNGNATGSAINDFAETIVRDIQKKTGIVLVREVQSVGNFS